MNLDGIRWIFVEKGKKSDLIVVLLSQLSFLYQMSCSYVER